MFARRLRAARKAQGLTQAELAERAGLAVEVCGRLERGAVVPRSDTVVRLSLALAVSTDSLLGGADEPVPRSAREPEAAYDDPPELRRLVRRLRGESPRTLRLLDALVSSMRRGARR